MLYGFTALYNRQELERKDGKFILTTVGQDDVWEETITYEQARQFAIENIGTLTELKEFSEWGIDYLEDHGDGSYENINLAYFRGDHLICPYRDELVWKGKNFSIFKTNSNQICDAYFKPLPFMYVYMYDDDNGILFDGEDIDIKIKGGKILLKFDENDIASVEECDRDFEDNSF